MRTSWYVEIWASRGVRAQMHDRLPNAVVAVAWIRANIGPEVILRVLAPASATSSELQELKNLGAVLG